MELGSKDKASWDKQREMAFWIRITIRGLSCGTHGLIFEERNKKYKRCQIMCTLLQYTSLLKSDIRLALNGHRVALFRTANPGSLVILF